MLEQILENRRIVTMESEVYQRNMATSYERGAVSALMKIGKTCPEIAYILEQPEPRIQHVVDTLEKKYAWEKEVGA